MDVNSFFTENSSVVTGSSKCNLPIYYLSDYGDEALDWLDVEYNINTGTISIIPNQGYDAQNNTYLIYIDGIKSDILPDSNGHISLSGLSKIPDNKIVKHVLTIVIMSNDRSNGYTIEKAFEYNINDIYINNQYSIEWNNMQSDIIYDLSGFTYKWYINDIYTSLLTGSSPTIDDKVLSLITDSIDAEISVKIVEFDLLLVGNTYNIDRNKYNITANIEPVVAGSKIYGNIIASGADPLIFFIDNQRLRQDYIEYSSSIVGKKMQVVYSNNDLDIFDKNNLDDYISYIEIEIEDKSFDAIRYTDYINNTENFVGNTQYQNRRIPFISDTVNDFFSILNFKQYNHETNDGKFKIELSSPSIRDRAGRIYYFENKLYCIDEDLTPREVNINNLVKKDVIMIDEEAVNMIQDSVTFDAYFGLQSDSGLQTDSHGWIYQPNENMEMAFDKVLQKRITQLQFSLKYEKTASNALSKILFIFYTTNNEHIYIYGIEKLVNGLFRLHDNDGLKIDMHQDKFEKQFVVKLATRYNIERISIVMNNCKNHNMMVRDIVISEEK